MGWVAGVGSDPFPLGVQVTPLKENEKKNG